MSNNPNVVSIRGRLSFPTLTVAEAKIRNTRSSFPKADDKIAPEFQVLVTELQLDKFVKHINDVYLPWLEAQIKNGEQKYKDVKPAKLIALLKSRDWADQPPYIPIKVVNEATQKLAPEAVASIKVSGYAGRDIIQKAIVRGPDDEFDPSTVRAKYPAIVPIDDTNFELYAGAEVGVTLDLYAFQAAGMPALKSSATTLVFRADAERFGGGVDVDEDALFDDD